MSDFGLGAWLNNRSREAVNHSRPPDLKTKVEAIEKCGKCFQIELKSLQRPAI